MKKRFTYSLIATSILSAFSTATVAADDQAEPVVVTASRHSESAADALASTTIITRDDIDASTAASLEELLEEVAGLDVRSSSSFGKNTSIFMRGTNSSHVLTLVDGVKLFSATGGSAAYQHIPLSQIDRIEIVRGPRSGLYGSEAIGGVIQIFTRKGGKESVTELGATAGSFNTSEVSAGTRGKEGKLSYSVYVSQFDTDGIDAQEHTTVNDNDGYLKQSFTTRLGYELSKTSSVDFSYLNSAGDVMYDNCYNASYTTSDNCTSDFEQEVAALTFKMASQGIWDGVLKFGQSKDLNDNFWEGAPNNTYQTDHSSVTFQNNFQVSEKLLVIAGIDQVEDTVEATPYTVYDRTRDNTALFTSVKQSINNFSYKLAVRSDDNEQFGRHDTGSISAGYELDKQTRLYASYGTAFKAPTFNELYFPFYGNTGLVPEESASTEFGLKQKTGWGRWSASIYQTTVDNLIAYDSGLGTANNISKADISGVELTANTKLAGWTTKASVSYVDPVNKDAAYLDNLLPARAKQSVALSASKAFGKAKLFVQLKNQGDRYGDAANTTLIQGYTVANTKLSYQLQKNMTLEAKINNLFDEDYQVNAGYNTPGRNAMVSIRYLMK